MWRTPQVSDFLLSAGGQIRDCNSFAPWQFLVEACNAPEDRPVSDFEVSPLWAHSPSSPARTIIVSDSCLTTYNDADDEINLVPKAKGVPAVKDDFVRVLRTELTLGTNLVNRVVPDDQLMTTAHEIARSLADGPWALGSIRKLIWDSLDNDWLQQLHAERVAQKTAGRTADFREGVMAFLQKRVAVFTRK